jgi:hypothetical protein
VTRSRGAILRIGLFASVLVWSPPVPASAETDVGVVGAVLAGTHAGADNPQPVSAVGAAGLLEVSQIWPRWRIHLEGIPQINVSASSAGTLGTSTASLSLLNAEAQVDLDRHHFFRLGAGVQVVNLSNFNGNNGDINQSRITTPLFTAVANLPAGHRRSVEATLTVGPNVQGILHVFSSSGASRTPKPEQGAEVDYGAAYAWNYPGATYLLGFRGLSYHTKNTNNGELVDSNVGGAITLEARFRFGRK